MQENSNQCPIVRSIILDISVVFFEWDYHLLLSKADLGKLHPISWGIHRTFLKQGIPSGLCICLAPLNPPLAKPPQFYKPTPSNRSIDTYPGGYLWWTLIQNPGSWMASTTEYTHILDLEWSSIFVEMGHSMLLLLMCIHTPNIWSLLSSSCCPMLLLLISDVFNWKENHIHLISVRNEKFFI